jgi:hypothetical protein
MVTFMVGWPPSRSVLTLHACGLLLVVFGPRLILLLATTAASLDYFAYMWMTPGAQIAEEYLPLVFLPLAGSLLAMGLIWKPGGQPSDSFDPARLSSQMDEVQVSLFRVVVLCFMFWAAFHKLNADFFNPQVSCSFLPYPPLGRRLLLANESVAQLVPFVGFLGEAGVSLLLLFYPRVGVAFTLVVMSVIGHGGPTPICTLVVVASLSFLQRGDAAIMLAGWRRYWLPSTAALVGLLILSSLFFPRRRPWLEYFFFELATGGVLFSYVHVLAEEIRQRWSDPSRAEMLRRFPKPDLHSDPVLPSVRWARALLLVTVLASVVNGLTPYLGLKYRMSFGMFANLRADDDRWNSLLVPRWFYLRDHDPFVHVTKATLGLPTAGEKVDSRRILSEGLFTSTEMQRRIIYMQRVGIRAGLQFSYAGVERNTEDATSDYGLWSLLQNIDENDRFFRSDLTLGKPQVCKH